MTSSALCVLVDLVVYVEVGQAMINAYDEC
jgi:hypothetical protein